MLCLRESRWPWHSARRAKWDAASFTYVCVWEGKESAKWGCGGVTRMSGLDRFRPWFNLHMISRWYVEHHGYLSQKCRLCTSSRKGGVGGFCYDWSNPQHTISLIPIGVCPSLCEFDFTVWEGDFQTQREVTLGQERGMLGWNNGHCLGIMYVILCVQCSFSDWSETTSC